MEKLLKVPLPRQVELRSVELWDAMVAKTIPKVDLVIGYASQSLRTGRSAKRYGARYFLDRACPHTDFQQQLMREEAEQVGIQFSPQPAWFRERQLAEYDEAEVILVPSHYTSSSFPAKLQPKLVKLPLLGRIPAMTESPVSRNPVFTVGIVGGQPMRKGFIYLLEAWRRLALPNARLLLRTNPDFSPYPRLAELLGKTSNVEFVGYVQDMRSFYRQCDTFILSSVDDGFGMALFEAMSAGVASIASTNCGSSELIENNVDGLVIAPRNVEQIMESILRLYEDEPLRQRLGAAGARRVGQIAKSEIYTDAWFKLLEDKPLPSRLA
jgi:glycosyltransferase involved in cell wall biosynthesis